MASLFIGWLILNLGTDIYNTYFREKDDLKISRALQFDVYERATKIDLINYDNKKFFDDYIWNVNDAKGRFLGTYVSIISIITATVGIVLYGGFIISADIFGIILISITIIAQYFLNKKTNKINYQKTMDLRPIGRVRDYVKRVFYMNDYASELRMGNINSKFFDLNRKSTDDSIKLTKRVAKSLMIIDFLNTFVMDHLAFDVIYILYLAYKSLVLKLMSYGTIISLIRSQWSFSRNINSFIGELTMMHQNSLYIDKYKEFLLFRPNIKSGDYRIDHEKIETIELKNVSFSYEENHPILKNINIKINKNEKIAIVGQNGAGKTTLANIILRLYEIDSGELLINGRQIETIDLESYKSRFSAVFQDFFLYAASIRENISLDIIADEVRLAEAMQRSRFNEKLLTFDKGLDTPLTKEFDNAGVNLSGGETQKIALARAIYRKSDIIMMDEPSSALDPIAEAHLNETIMEIAKDRIVFFISHRLSTAKIADRIFFIENGEIVESGSHSELMLLNGKYAKMFNIQALKYHKT
jgi:ATP-binding cassette subfamily B protein